MMGFPVVLGRAREIRDRTSPLVAGMLGAGVLVLAAGCAAPAGEPDPDPTVRAYLAQQLRGMPGPVHYFLGEADLNGDGRKEVLAHVAGPAVCGTGGCDTFVFEGTPQGLEPVGRIGLTRPPVAAAGATSHGWRDLLVEVSGGGIIPGYTARLRFDGRAYPENPTVPPTEAAGEVRQREVIIPEFQDFREGRTLIPGPE